MTSGTRSTDNRQLTNTSSKSEAGPSIERRVVGHAQTVGQSDSGPSNARHITIGEPLIQDNNTGSPLSSSPQRHLSLEELQEKVDTYENLIREYESNNATRAKGKGNVHSGTKKSHQKKVTYYHQKILDELDIMMEQFNAKGFVYGMVTETSKPLTASSDSLRAWWKGEAVFDKSGPAKIEQYYKANALPSDVTDVNNKSTAELLDELSDPTLGSILSLLIQQCDPPQRKFPFENGLSPPWWPTTHESWWGQTGIPIEEGPPPFRKPHDLRKKWKVALLITIIKLMAPKFSNLLRLVEKSPKLGNRMNAKEKKFWTLALVAEAKRFCQDRPDMLANEAIAFLIIHL